MIVDSEKYEKIGEPFGKGAQGIVYKVLNREDKKYYAMKIILNNNDINKTVKKLIKIKHENIVEYFGYFVKDHTMNIIMEYCDYSNLKTFIEDHKKSGTKINQKIILIIALDICRGIIEIHKNKLIHRDLKPENIFINREYKIKIGDFGISKQLSDHTKVAYTQIGTEFYYAPEILENKNYDNKVDIWALGCIIYELCALKKCFNSRNEIINKIKSQIKFYGRIDLNYYNKDLQDIIYKLLEPNPEKRPNIEEAYNLINNCNNNFNLDETSLNILNRHNNQINIEDEGLLPRENENEDNKELEMINLNKENFTNKKGLEESLIDNNNKNYLIAKLLKYFGKHPCATIDIIGLIIILIIGIPILLINIIITNKCDKYSFKSIYYTNIDNEEIQLINDKYENSICKLEIDSQEKKNIFKIYF